MEGYFRGAAGVLIAVVLITLLAQQGKSIASLLGLAMCTMVLALGVSYLQPVLDFAVNLKNLGGLNGELVAVLLKAVGISLISEVAVLICSDSGNQSMGKALHILTCAVLLWLSVPVFQALMDLMVGILEGI